MAGATDLAPPPAVEPEEVALAVDLKGDAAPQQVMLRAFNQLIRQIVRKRLVPAGLATVEVGPAALVRTSLARHRTAQRALTPAQVTGPSQHRVARHDGKCVACGEWIAEGDVVTLLDGQWVCWARCGRRAAL